MLVDDLERRAAEVRAGRGTEIGRAFEIMAVGVAWSLPGTLLGLLAATLASVWADSITCFGLFGTLLGGLVGLWVEAASNPLDFPAL
jgi:hypothetical protein